LIQSYDLFLGRSQRRCEISDWCSRWHEDHERRGDWDVLESLVRLRHKGSDWCTQTSSSSEFE